MTEISIIILNYQTKGLLRQSLKGIMQANLDLEYEIIVVDNASSDGSAEMVADEFSQVRLIRTKKNNGCAAGNNLGIRVAQGRYILLLNPDVVVFPKTIEKMYEFMENHLRAAVAGPKLVNANGTIQYTSYRFHNFLTPLYRRTFLGKLPFGKRELRRFLMQDWDHQTNREVDWLQGSCLMVRRSAIDEIGLIDERFFMYFEDTDWCRRFKKSGWQIYYLADVKMAHYYRRQ